MGIKIMSGPNKRKANARKRAKQMEAGKKRRLQKEILSLMDVFSKGHPLYKETNAKLALLLERYKSRYGTRKNR